MGDSECVSELSNDSMALHSSRYITLCYPSLSSQESLDSSFTIEMTTNKHGRHF